MIPYPAGIASVQTATFIFLKLAKMPKKDCKTCQISMHKKRREQAFSLRSELLRHCRERGYSRRIVIFAQPMGILAGALTERPPTIAQRLWDLPGKQRKHRLFQCDFVRKTASAILRFLDMPGQALQCWISRLQAALRALRVLQETIVQMDAIIWALFWCFQWFSARGFSHSTWPERRLASKRA